MAKPGLMRSGVLAALLVGAGLPAAAQQLDPRVAGPLMQLMEAAAMQCRAGNPQACELVPQLQQAGQELSQAQFACQQGNPEACQVFQAGAQQVVMAWQQNFGGQGPAMSQQQQTFEHQQRMQQQQMQFQQQQQRYQQQQRANDLQHQRFMEQLRR